MLEPSSREVKQYHLLVCFCVLVTFFAAFLIGKRMALQDFFPPGKALITVQGTKNGPMWGEPTVERGPTALSKTRLNSGSLEELLACPGIGPVMAEKLQQERKKKPFSDWEDLQNRIPGMGTVKILRLQEAGVEIGSSTP